MTITPWLTSLLAVTLSLTCFTACNEPSHHRDAPSTDAEWLNHPKARMELPLSKALGDDLKRLHIPETGDDRYGVVAAFHAKGMSQEAIESKMAELFHIAYTHSGAHLDYVQAEAWDDNTLFFARRLQANPTLDWEQPKQALIANLQKVWITGDSKHPEPPHAKAVPYTIVEVKDISTKYIPGRLSDYTASELQRRPQIKRKTYRVVVPQTITAAEVYPTIEKLVKEVTQDADLDAAVFWLYSSKAHVASGAPYDIAMATWAPGGDVANITEAILETNNRSTYTTAIDLVDNFEQGLAQAAKPETKGGFTEAQRRQIFKELILAERRGAKEAEKLYPELQHGSGEAMMAQFKKQSEKMSQLQEKYEAQVIQKYHLTQTQQDNILTEAYEEHWPTPAWK